MIFPKRIRRLDDFSYPATSLHHITIVEYITYKIYLFLAHDILDPSLMKKPLSGRIKLKHTR